MDTIIKTQYLEFKYADTESGGKWHYVKRTNDSNSHDSAVVITTIVKIDNEYNFILLKTKRPPMLAENKSQYCIESPAGLIADENSNETLFECAKKELLEEAGIKSDNIYLELTNSPTSSGLSSETLSYITSISDKYEIIKEPVSDNGVIFERFNIPVDKIFEFISNNDNSVVSIASCTITGIYLGLNRLKTLNLI